MTTSATVTKPLFGHCGAVIREQHNYLTTKCAGERLCSNCQRLAVDFIKDYKPVTKSPMDLAIDEATVKLNGLKARLTGHVLPDLPTVQDLDQCSTSLKNVKDLILRALGLFKDYSVPDPNAPLVTSFDCYRPFEELYDEVLQKVKDWRKFLADHTVGERYQKVITVITQLINVDRPLSTEEVQLLKTFNWHAQRVREETKKQKASAQAEKRRRRAEKRRAARLEKAQLEAKPVDQVLKLAATPSAPPRPESMLKINYTPKERLNYEKLLDRMDKDLLYKETYDRCLTELLGWHLRREYMSVVRERELMALRGKRIVVTAEGPESLEADKAPVAAEAPAGSDAAEAPETEPPVEGQTGDAMDAWECLAA